MGAGDERGGPRRRGWLVWKCRCDEEAQGTDFDYDYDYYGYGYGYDWNAEISSRTILIFGKILMSHLKMRMIRCWNRYCPTTNPNPSPTSPTTTKNQKMTQRPYAAGQSILGHL